MNWRELKEFCNSLDDEKLDVKVVLWRDDEAITSIECEQLEEDHYIDPDDSENGCFPESNIEMIVNVMPDTYPDGKNNLKKVYDKGHPIMWEEIK